jgi:hypothetical protein
MSGMIHPRVLDKLTRLESLVQRAGSRDQQRGMEDYSGRPLDYIRDVLHIQLWAKQAEIAESLLRPPYRTLVKASHNVGKTFLAAALVSWWFDTFDPGLVLTTAPTEVQVRDVLWKEIRTQREAVGRGGFRGPKMPRLESSANHWAFGFTARDGEAFQGRHAEHVMIIFDESVGVEPIFWETAKSMFGGQGHAWLAIHNPTDTTSQAYLEESTGNWNVISMSALEHPNILAELQDQPSPFPSAMRLARLDEMLREWCSPVGGERRATDIEWPPTSGTWLRPGPLAEARLLGRWPSQGTYGVWSDADWQAAETTVLTEPDGMIEIGCDVARFGDDWTAIHIRRGGVSLHHEAANGWSTSETAGRLKQLAREWGTRLHLDPTRVLIRIDDDGVGGGVVDQAGDFAFMPISAAGTSFRPQDYPNRRSELWFTTALRARSGQLSFAQLPRDVRQRLRQQAMAPTWKLDAAGRRVVEKKEETKEKLGRSPDDMDAVNLAYLEGPRYDIPRIQAEKPVGTSWDARRAEQERYEKRPGLFGYSR